MRSMGTHVYYKALRSNKGFFFHMCTEAFTQRMAVDFASHANSIRYVLSVISKFLFENIRIDREGAICFNGIFTKFKFKKGTSHSYLP